jgi:hypothetical protein
MKKTVFRLTAVLLAVLSAFAVAEGILRFVPSVPGQGVSTVTAGDFARIPGIHAPGQSLVDRSDPGLPYQVTVNRWGYRGEDFPLAKPEGELRILLVGDSFTYGAFVDDSSTLPVQLERQLEDACGPATVINAGLGGSTIVGQAALALRGLRASPDLVLLMFYENDVQDLTHPLWPQLESNREVKSRPPLSWVYPVARRTALWNLLLKVRAKARNRAGKSAQAIWDRDADSVVTSLRREYTDRLYALHDSLAQKEVPLAVAVYPSHHSVWDSTLNGQLEWLADMLSAREIPWWDFSPVLRESALPDTSLYFLPLDGHPRPIGYRMAADSLSDWLLEQDAVARLCGRNDVERERATS